MLIAQVAQGPQEAGRGNPHAAFRLDRLDQDRAGLRPDRALHRFDVAERHLVEAVDHGTEAFEIFRGSGGREGRERAAVERAFEGDDAVAFRLAVRPVILAGDLDAELVRLGAGIIEKDEVGEGRRAQALGEPLALGNAEQVGDVPQLLRLRGDRLDELRVGMAERIHGDAAGEVEIALAVGRRQPSALAPLESEVDPRVGGQ